MNGMRHRRLEIIRGLGDGIHEDRFDHRNTEPGQVTAGAFQRNLCGFLLFAV